MKTFLTVLSVFCTTLTFGQRPRPYVTGNVNLMPAGYASVSFGGTAGVEWNPRYAAFDAYAGYDTGRKDNDGTGPNYSGRDRFLRGFAGYKHGLYYAGVGARWSELSTSNYTKGGNIFSAGSWHPEIGGGRDWNTRDYPLFMRTQVAYMFAPSHEVVHYPGGGSCDGCGNGSHGADITLWFPSPAHSGHFFAKMNVVLFRYHTTITEPTNIPLTRQQMGQKSLADSTEFMIGARF